MTFNRLRLPVLFLFIQSVMSCKDSPFAGDYPGRDSVLVRVVNKSNFRITSLLLIHDGGSIRSGNIPPGDSARFVFGSGGENGVMLQVQLENHTGFITSPEMYTEGGYRIIETVYNDSIQAKYFKRAY